VRICVVGCGAVGSLFAANLARLDDVEVWAYDPWQEHVDAINAHGLRLSGREDVDVSGWREACAGLPLAHMGRGPDDDPWFFAAAYAAGRLARELRR